ncbi:DNA-directed RNA polymerase subunit beta [Paenibacillus sedimenti]|uniref:DNA-directed RNA polymerase subunit beta n=1 Tax=Paenibacillus sedimenti TaxID=2770274 RepID=A0A926KWR8_9BACL|nr:DNA-directed RNA polymerase subunit beta [Paenibacillus sedimenti]MBD0384291.1 DNA-directed RNA polymerase subunit beta [Paenibacillus sedimenti]
MPDKSTPKKKKPQPKWLKITFLILKIIRVPVLAVLAVYIGLWIGYTKLGQQPASEIFHMSTWRHLYDLVFAN